MFHKSLLKNKCIESPAAWSSRPLQLEAGLHDPTIEVVVLAAPASEEVWEAVEGLVVGRPDGQDPARHLRVGQHVPEFVDARASK